MEAVQNADRKPKLIHIEVLRIVAILFVVFNHTKKTGYVRFIDCGMGTISYWLNLANAVMIKCAVPVFFLISGGLLIKKTEESSRKHFVKILKYAAILLVISVFYAISDSVLLHKTYTVETFFKTLYSSKIKYHLWFLYAYIAFLVFLPLLKAFVIGMKTRHFLYLAAIYFIYSSISPIEYLLWKNSFNINQQLAPAIPYYAIILPVFGHFLENRIDIEKNKNVLWGLWIVNVCCIAFSCYMEHIRGIDLGRFKESDLPYLGKYAWVNAIAVYLTVKYLFSKIKVGKHITKVIEICGSCCFGVFLFHPLFRDMPYMKPFLNRMKSSGIPMIIVSWVYVFSLVIPSFILTILMRKSSKVLKKLIIKQ